MFTGNEFDVKAKCVINATGPFTDSLRRMDDQQSQNICQPSAGVHIVIPGYYRFTKPDQAPPSAPPSFLCFTHLLMLHPAFFAPLTSLCAASSYFCDSSLFFSILNTSFCSWSPPALTTWVFWTQQPVMVGSSSSCPGRT